MPGHQEGVTQLKTLPTGAANTLLLGLSTSVVNSFGGVAGREESIFADRRTANRGRYPQRGLILGGGKHHGSAVGTS